MRGWMTTPKGPAAPALRVSGPTPDPFRSELRRCDVEKEVGRLPRRCRDPRERVGLGHGEPRFEEAQVLGLKAGPPRRLSEIKAGVFTGLLQSSEVVSHRTRVLTFVAKTRQAESFMLAHGPEVGVYECFNGGRNAGRKLPDADSPLDVETPCRSRAPRHGRAHGHSVSDALAMGQGRVADAGLPALAAAGRGLRL